MKKLFGNAYFKNYLVLIISLFSIEIIFKLISGSTLLDWSTLRIFFVINLISAIFAFILNVCNSLVTKIITSILVFAAGVYTCLQAGFYNFLGVYISFQTSSQLGAVVDYITDFLKSFKGIYFLPLVPFVLLLVFFIFFDKKKLRNLNGTFNGLATLILVVVMSGLFYGSVTLETFQNKMQSVSNKDLFLTASNPSITIDQFGSMGFCILDVKALLFPVVLQDNFEVKQPTKTTYNENSRIIDDEAWNLLIDSEKDDTYKYLNNYFINRNITDKNDYTGMFEGKNLIVIMMESVDDIFLDPEYYPNFNKIVSEGWYWENNYSPRNSCATMNNEFSGMTSLYSIYNTCTASKYKTNTYYESMFNLFNNTDYVTFSAHDYTEAYYPRKKIHTGMGSGEYYGVQKLGISYSNEYRNWANDDEFMESILKIIDKKTSNGENFMTWLTSVSSHQPYSSSSIQGDKYYDMTKSTKYPTDVRRYMSKLKFLDDGLGILLEGLEERGILEDTVIVLYGDHYPYGISTKNLNKVLDYDTSVDLNAERVPFVIYNSEIESKVFSEYTSYINILPTIANLFNLDYDPRLYLGTDLLSPDYESLVVFADGSWKNEKGFYKASKNKMNYYTSDEYTAEEIKRINDNITTWMNVSNKAIKSNYFEYLGKNLEIKKQEVENTKNTMCLNELKSQYTLDEE